VGLVIATSGTAAALAEASSAVPKRVAAVKGGATGAAKVAAGRTVVAKKTAGGVRAGAPTALTADVRRLADRLLKMSKAEREAVPGIGPKRAEIIVGGALVYASLLERLGLKGFRYSSMGLRDGMLAQMLGETDLRASVHKKIEDERWAGVLEVARRYGIEERKAEPVRQHAVELFRGLSGMHGLPEEYRMWLESAAMMADVGKFMNHQGHFRHTQYIIANSEIFGFSPEQRGIVSAIARYQGKTRPESMDRPMRMLPVEEHTHVRRAVVLLRLAMALNQDRASAVLKMKTIVYPKRVLIELVPGRGGAELEAWALRREAAYFREVFRRELAVEVV
jgi:exopolyphosphatase/guanosine-5'-triphosphate,3'-diphosphate pyrophosphatase